MKPEYVLGVAAKDRRFLSNDFRVLISLHGWIDAIDFLPVRVTPLAREIFHDQDERRVTGTERVAVHRSLKRLQTFGYLECQTKAVNGTQISTYRLRTPLRCSNTATVQAA